MSASPPLLSRPLDFLYVVFFAIHIPITTLIDLPNLVPHERLPSFLLHINQWAMAVSNDPLIKGVQSGYGHHHWVWIQTFIVLEFAFQLPTFFIGIWGLYKGSKSVYPLLAVYGASTATTVIPCIATLVTTPSASDLSQAVGSITQEQYIILMTSYLPFLFIPLLLAVDMTIRLVGLIHHAEKLQGANKLKRN